jgi:hypothetical protein
VPGIDRLIIVRGLAAHLGSVVLAKPSLILTEGHGPIGAEQSGGNDIQKQALRGLRRGWDMVISKISIISALVLEQAP